MDKTCTTCKAPTFDSTTSTSYLSTGTSTTVTNSDGSTVTGLKSTDTFALDLAGTYGYGPTTFLLGKSQVGYQQISGVLGLMRVNAASDYKNFFDVLLQNSKVASNIFSVYMADKAAQSTFQVGGYDSAYIKSPNTLTQLPV